MIDVYIDITRPKIKDNLGLILEAFFGKCYNVNVRNLNIAIFRHVHIEILKVHKPEISFDEIKEYFVAAVIKPGYYKPTGKKDPNQIQQVLITHESFIDEFKKSAFKKMEYFLKHSNYNLSVPRHDFKNLEYVIIKNE